MTPEQHGFVVTVGFSAIVLQLAVVCLAIRIGRYLGGREDHERAYLSGYAAGRRDERSDAARDPLMPRTWSQAGEAFYPVHVEALPEGGYCVRSPGRPL